MPYVETWLVQKCKKKVALFYIYSTLVSFLANISIHWWPLCSDIGTVSVHPTTSRNLSQKEEAISNYFYTMVVWTRTIYIAVNSMIYWSIDIFFIWICKQVMRWKSSFLVCSETPIIISSGTVILSSYTENYEGIIRV